MNGFFWILPHTPASKPGDDLLFRCLSNSTIGAVWFHGRVRDGIGWVTDAMITKLWSRRMKLDLEIDACTKDLVVRLPWTCVQNCR